MVAKGAVVVLAFSVLLVMSAVPYSAAVPSNLPSQPVGLLVTIIPPKLPADGNVYPAVVVSLVDSNGLPSAAITNLTVFLTSSETNIASVNNSITIPAGSEYVVANVVTTTTPGSATITASAHGYNSYQATLTTVTPSGFPAQLEVFVTPTGFLQQQPDNGSVRVELVDDAGFPSKAITPVDVILSSSNNTVASLDQSTLTIEPGEIYATGSFNTFDSAGQALITGSSTGYRSGEAVVTVYKSTACIPSCGASELELKLLPAVLPTGGSSYAALEVGLATSKGLPAVSSSATIVTLSSDTPNVVSVLNPTVIIPAGTISILVSLTTSALEGKATITATSANLEPATASVTTTIPAPSAIQAYIAPPSLFTSSIGNAPMLVLQLQDSSGNPARARQQTEITVTSSNASMVVGPLTLTIPKGSDDVVTHLTATGSGSSVLTASSQDLSSSEVTLSLVKSPLVVRLEGYLPRGVLYTNETLPVTLSVEFLGEAVNGANVTWIATYGTILPSTSNTGESGLASARYTPQAAGGANVTAEGTSPQTGPFRASYLFVVLPPPNPLPLTFGALLIRYWYLLVAAIAAVIIVVLYFIRRRRKKQREEIEAGFEVV